MNERETVDEIIAEEKLWSNGSVIAYHVTPSSNILGIERKGIDPACSRGKLEASWYVTKNGILWAIAHCSARHGVSADELYVCTVMLPRNSVKRTSLPQMFYVKERYAIDAITPAVNFIFLKGGENE